MDELRPCPFCGGEACVGVGRLITSDFGSDAYAYVTCGECGASTDEVYGDKADESEIVKQAVAAWNRRAERTCRMVDCGSHDTCVVNRELSDGNIMSMEFGYKQCSECGANVFDCPTVRYCPDCGARVVDE